MFSVIPLGRRVALCMPLVLSLCGWQIVFAQQTVEVVIQRYRFEPAAVQIRVGDTVKWVNQEKRTSHSVLFSPEQGGESERFFPGESWSRKFDAPGRYAYSCGPHPEMKGVVEVVAP